MKTSPRRNMTLLVSIITRCGIALLMLSGGSCLTASETQSRTTAENPLTLQWIKLDESGSHFVRSPSGNEFIVWGVNYDHNRSGRLIEDYWHSGFDTVREDFKEIKKLGANAVRIHLQLGRFMKTPKRANQAELKQLARVVELAETTGLYLDITGLGCYHKKDVPAWYAGLSEQERWKVQARFWETVAKTCAGSPAVFCYDLMNEPVLPGKEKETEWLPGSFGGKHFVQRISLDLAGRSRTAVAEKWINLLVSAIRKHDRRHLVTVGIIPWAFHFYPKAKKLLFYSEEAGGRLDFVSVHFYPKKGAVDTALKALKVYDIGKPLVIEEMFPLKCSLEELDIFIDRSKETVEGWISFYWGKTIEEYAKDKPGIQSALIKEWLEYFRASGAEKKPGQHP